VASVPEQMHALGRDRVVPFVSKYIKALTD
jgi:hypothetical protein